MKRTLWTVAMTAILGMAAISCNTTSTLEDVVIEDTAMNGEDAKDDEVNKPGSN